MVYTVGQIIEEAKVVNIREFGVFVEIDSSLTGLIHFLANNPQSWIW